MSRKKFNRVLSLCDKTGNVVKPWADKGYECTCVDIQHSIRADKQTGNIKYVWGDVRSYVPENLQKFDFIFAFPPCTDLSVSGARDFEKKGLRKLIDALDLVESCRMICELSGAPYLIENPVSRLASCWRKPDYTFNPCDYGGYLNPKGDEYTKKTCLWTGGGFVMPPKKPVEPTLGSKMHLMSPGPERANLRSETPMGFATAVYIHNADN